MVKFRVFAATLVAALLLVACGGSSHRAVTTKHQAGPLICKGGFVTQYGCSAHSPSFGVPPKGAPKLTAPSNVPTIEMFDAVSVSAIPHGPRAVAGYLSGSWPTWFSLKADFPSAFRVPVAIRDTPVYPSLVGHMACMDVEPGDAVPSEAGPWARGERGLGVKPCIYANLSTMPAVRASLTSAGLTRSQYFLWVADWTYHPGLDSGFDAAQWTNHGPHGENYDESTVSYAFLGINPSPQLPVCFHKRISRFQCNGIKEQIAKDTRGAASSQRAYKARGCPVLAQRVSWFSGRLKKHPKTKTTSRKRALAASRHAYSHRSCATFHSRVVYFTTTAAKLKAGN